MRPNVKQLIQLLAEQGGFPEPIVDIGALRTEGQEDYADLRPFFGTSPYMGMDMRHGSGVDCVGTLHNLPLRPESAGTILVLDTLEHVLDPLAAMAEVTQALRPGGVVVMSSHMNFPIHAHPSDYWRFTPMVFDHLMRSLSQRVVLVQGNTENPHTVFGIGCKATDAGQAERFVQAVRGFRDAWPDESFGGCLFAADPLLLDIEQRAPDRDLPPLMLGRMISQTFICREEGLARIEVLMACPTGESLRHLLFRVRDVGRAEDIGALRILALQVVDGEWLSIEFVPQPDSAGREYEVILTSPDGDAQRGVSAKASMTAVHADGRLRIDGELADGSLCIKTFCRPAQGAVLDPWAAADSAQAQEAGANGGAQEEWHRTRYERAMRRASEDAEQASAVEATGAPSTNDGATRASGLWRRITGGGTSAKK